MATKQQYSIVGRYINEDDTRDVVGYHLRNLEGTKQGRYSIEQVAFLIGKDQVINCTVQLYKDKVLFRGKGISLDSLPSQKIKVNRANRVGSRQQVTDNNASVQKPKVEVPRITGLKIRETLTNVFKKYGFGKPNGVNINIDNGNNEPYLKIVVDVEVDPQTTNRSHYEFIIDARDNEYFYLRQTDFINDYIIRGKRSEGLERFLVKAIPFVGIVHIESYNQIADMYDAPSTIQSAFESYSGNSDQIASTLRGRYGTAKETGVDHDYIPVSFVETLIMIMKYASIKNDKQIKMPIFRGDKREASNINASGWANSFVSTSYCPMVAAEFSSGKILLCIEGAPINNLVNVEDIAVVEGEFEILVGMGTNIEIIEPIGKFSGATIYRAKLKRAWGYKECIQHLVKSYSKYINESLLMYSVYKLALSVKNPIQIEIKGMGYEYLVIHSQNNANRYVSIHIPDYAENKSAPCKIDLSGTDSIVIKHNDDIKQVISYLVNGVDIKQDTLHKQLDEIVQKTKLAISNVATIRVNETNISNDYYTNETVCFAYLQSMKFSNIYVEARGYNGIVTNYEIAFKDEKGNNTETFDASGDISKDDIKRVLQKAVDYIKCNNISESVSAFYSSTQFNKVTDGKIEFGTSSVTTNNLVNKYYEAVKIITDKHKERAYYINESYKEIMEYKSDYMGTKINIDFIQGNLYYISLNIWGFDENTMDSEERDKLIVSKTTMQLLNQEFPAYITQTGFKDSKSSYKRVHYHDVIIRIREFRYITQFKWLKIHYLLLNDQVFDGKLRKDLIVTGYNYGGVSETENGAIAFQYELTNQIAFNANYNDIKGKKLTYGTRLSFIHEMCHEYADEFLGGNLETDPNNYGDKLFGIESYGPDQLKVHGKKFGQAVEFASQKTGIPFGDIFGYGLRHAGKKEPYYVTDTGELTRDSYSSRENTKTIKTAQYDDCKEWYNNNINNILNYLNVGLNSEIYNCKVELHNEKVWLNPVFIDITSGQTFSEAYKIIFTITYKHNIVINVYRDYKQDNKGYIVAKENIALSVTGDKLENTLNNIVNSIKRDLEDI